MTTKVYIIQREEGYEYAGIAGAFFDEAQANAEEERLSLKDAANANPYHNHISYMAQPVDVAYSHRNGETEPPEMEGYYWIIPDGGGHNLSYRYWDAKRSTWRWADADASETVSGYQPVSYYGPIPMPKRKESIDN